MPISLPDARQLSDDVLEALRLRAVHGCELGYSEAQLAELLGVARETVSRWVSAYRAGGRDALPHDRTGRPTGSGRTLTDVQATQVQHILDHSTPEQAGIPAPLWNRRAVAALLYQEYGIVMPVRTVGLYLRRWGYTAKRPRRHARAQDPQEVRDWLRHIYPGIEERAAEENATIYWCDETGVAADEHPGLGYARAGQAATVEVPDSHIRVNLISAVSNQGDMRFMTFVPAMTGVLFITFLERLLRSTAAKVYLIVDRLPAHLTAGVSAWVAAQAERLELFHLPTYAPELNADEYVNNALKAEVNAAGLPHNRVELRGRVQRFMHHLLHLPEHVRNFFQHPSVQYAAGNVV